VTKSRSTEAQINAILKGSDIAAAATKPSPRPGGHGARSPASVAQELAGTLLNACAVQAACVNHLRQTRHPSKVYWKGTPRIEALLCCGDNRSTYQQGVDFGWNNAPFRLPSSRECPGVNCVTVNVCRDDSLVVL